MSRDRAQEIKIPDPLTEREVQVVRLVYKQNKEIAHILGLSERTVRGHLHHVFSKTGLGTRTEVALWAAKEGILSLRSLPL